MPLNTEHEPLEQMGGYSYTLIGLSDGPIIRSQACMSLQ